MDIMYYVPAPISDGVTAVTAEIGERIEVSDAHREISKQTNDNIASDLTSTSQCSFGLGEKYVKSNEKCGRYE